LRGLLERDRHADPRAFAGRALDPKLSVEGCDAVAQPAQTAAAAGIGASDAVVLDFYGQQAVRFR